MHTFGAGVLIATPSQDALGNAISVPSPVQFGILQDVSIDDSSELKELYGANQYPVDVGRGKGKVNIKAKFAQINAALYNSVYYGQSLVAGYQAIVQDLVGTVVPSAGTAIHITPTAPTGGTSAFARDLGVQDGNGVPYTRVSASPTAGQYSLAGSTYTFSDLDVGKTVFINYAYSNATNPPGAKTLTVANLPMGSAPIFSIDFMAFKNGKTMYTRYPNAIATKLSGDYKNDDFTIPDFEASCFADSNGNIQYKYFYE